MLLLVVPLLLQLAGAVATGVVVYAGLLALLAVPALRRSRDGTGAGIPLAMLLTAAMADIQEWATGGLEHPNVVPIYDITLDEEGRPLIVLKRIDGEAWADLMDDPKAVRERFGGLVDGNGVMFPAEAPVELQREVNQSIREIPCTFEGFATDWAD